MMIEGNCAVVTGGASGLGLATAKLLARKGAKVAILDRDQALADSAARELAGLAVCCDVGDEHGVEAAFAQVVRELGTPRVCVNCAGIGPAKRIVGRERPMPLGDFAKVINVNLIGTFNVLRVAAAAMAAAEPLTDGERGVIINTASVAAFEGQIGQAAYAASKGGVVSLTLPAARELARYGIRVLTIAPGLFATPLMASLPEASQRELGASVPFPNRLGAPEEFAALAAHLAENPMMNGEVIRLDGALRMGVG